MLIAGSGRLRAPSRPRPTSRPSLLSRAANAIRSGRVTRTIRRATTTVQRQTQANVNRLKRAATATLPKLPWANQVQAVSKRVYHEVKSSQEQVSLARKAVKAGRVLRDGLNQLDGFKRFTGFAAQTGVAKTFSRVAGGVTKAASRVANSRVGKVATGTFNHGIRVADNINMAVTGELKSVQKTATKKVLQSADNAISRAAQSAASKLGAKGSANTAARVGAKALGRFTPGANIAVAAYDVYKARETLKDPKASNWKKGMAVATAGFSVVAATNIPVVSQVAAGLSLATEVASKASPKKLISSAKNLGSEAIDVGKKILGGL